MPQSFIFGGNTPWTYEDIQRKRRVADAMASQIGTPRNVGEGLSAIGKALAVRGINRRADKRNGELRDKFNDQWAGLLSGGAQPAVDPSSPEGIASDTMATLGKSRNYADAIASVESAGSGGYSAVGPDTGKGRAYGRYQVMDFNIGPWTEKYLGKRMSPQEFLADPKAQDAVFNGEFGGYVDKYGNPQDAASMWFSGKPMAAAGNASDGYNTVPEYVSKFNSALGGSGGGGMSIQALAEVAGSPYASPGQKAIVNALLQQQMQAMDPKSKLELDLLRKQVDAFGKPKPVQPTGTMREYDLARSQGFEGTFADYKTSIAKAGATNNNINIGGSSPGLGKLSSDYGYVLDPETGKPVIDPETGLPTAAPVPGSPAAQDIKEGERKKIGRTAEIQRAGQTVLRSIDRSLDYLPDVVGGDSPLGATGRIAKSKIPGTAEYNLSLQVEDMLSNVGLDRLQQMRDNSPTGGALGQVPIQQQKRLEQVLGSFNLAQPTSVIKENLRSVNNIYMEIMYGSKAERDLAIKEGRLTPEQNEEIEKQFYQLDHDRFGRKKGADDGKSKKVFNPATGKIEEVAQ